MDHNQCKPTPPLLYSGVGNIGSFIGMVFFTRVLIFALDNSPEDSRETTPGKNGPVSLGVIIGMEYGRLI